MPFDPSQEEQLDGSGLRQRPVTSQIQQELTDEILAASIERSKRSVISYKA